MTDPRYPIGKPSFAGPLTPVERRAAIQAIASAPGRLRKAVDGLSAEQLDTPYREGGWTVRQLVHHLADSHINAYSRFRFALTESNPTVMAYDENQWARLHDAATAPIEPSLALLDGLHGRWALLLQSLQAEDFARPLIHSASGPHDIDWLLAIYSWHGAHHTAHVTALRSVKAW